ncbi:MAG: hypothetical protein Q8Q35_00730 [Nanoarchaeota archaeon]|nr:hypothetical protein [Nanoarchaeota archaeon]
MKKIILSSILLIILASLFVFVNAEEVDDNGILDVILYCIIPDTVEINEIITYQVNTESYPYELELVTSDIKAGTYENCYLEGGDLIQIGNFENGEKGVTATVGSRGELLLTISIPTAEVIIFGQTVSLSSNTATDAKDSIDFGVEEGAKITLFKNAFADNEPVSDTFGYYIKVKEEGSSFILYGDGKGRSKKTASVLDIALEDEGLFFEISTEGQTGRGTQKNIYVNDYLLKLNDLDVISYEEDEERVKVVSQQDEAYEFSIGEAGKLPDYTFDITTGKVSVYIYEDSFSVEANELTALSFVLGGEGFDYTSSDNLFQLNSNEVLTFNQIRADEKILASLEIFDDAESGWEQVLCGQDFSSTSGNVLGAGSVIDFEILTTEAEDLEDSTYECNINRCEFYENKEHDDITTYSVKCGDESPIAVYSEQGLISAFNGLVATVENGDYTYECDDCLSKNAKIELFGEFIEDIDNFQRLKAKLGDNLELVDEVELVADSFVVGEVKFLPDTPKSYFSKGSLIVRLLDGIVKTRGLRAPANEVDRQIFKIGGSFGDKYEFEVDNGKLKQIDCCLTGDGQGEGVSGLMTYGCKKSNERNKLFVRGNPDTFEIASDIDRCTINEIEITPEPKQGDPCSEGNTCPSGQHCQIVANLCFDEQGPSEITDENSQILTSYEPDDIDALEDLTKSDHCWNDGISESCPDGEDTDTGRGKDNSVINDYVSEGDSCTEDKYLQFACSADKAEDSLRCTIVRNEFKWTEGESCVALDGVCNPNLCTGSICACEVSTDLITEGAPCSADDFAYTTCSDDDSYVRCESKGSVTKWVEKDCPRDYTCSIDLGAGVSNNPEGDYCYEEDFEGDKLVSTTDSCTDDEYGDYACSTDKTKFLQCKFEGSRSTNMWSGIGFSGTNECDRGSSCSPETCNNRGCECVEEEPAAEAEEIDQRVCTSGDNFESLDIAIAECSQFEEDLRFCEGVPEFSTTYDKILEVCDVDEDLEELAIYAEDLIADSYTEVENAFLSLDATSKAIINEEYNSAEDYLIEAGLGIDQARELAIEAEDLAKGKDISNRRNILDWVDDINNNLEEAEDLYNDLFEKLKIGSCEPDLVIGVTEYGIEKDKTCDTNGKIMYVCDSRNKWTFKEDCLNKECVGQGGSAECRSRSYLAPEQTLTFWEMMWQPLEYNKVPYHGY